MTQLLQIHASSSAPRFHAKMMALVLKVDHSFAPVPQQQSSGNKEVIPLTPLVWLGNEELKMHQRLHFLTAFTRQNKKLMNFLSPKSPFLQFEHGL